MSARYLLAGLVAVRIAIPLAALAASGSALPGLPRFDYRGLRGDATGFYAAAREFIAAAPRLGTAGAAALFLAFVLAELAVVLAWRHGRLASAWALVGATLVFSLLVTVLITQMDAPGAAVFGWPLVWSIPLFPLRALGVLDEDVAYAVGLVLSLTANAVTVVATYVLGLRASGRRAVAALAASLFAFWPLFMGVVAGERGWENSTWEVDAGLHMYTEPLSTALVTGALAVLLVARSPAMVAAAGVAFSLATLVKLSNGILAAVVLLVLLASRSYGLTRALPFAAGALTFAPALIAYWPRGYVPIFDNPVSFPRDPFSFDYVARNWGDSLLFSPRTLAVLLPLAAIGPLFVRSRLALALLVLPVLVNAAFYSLYQNTVVHPRFLFVSLPAVFVLWAAGAAGIAEVAGTSLRRRKAASTPAS